MFFIQSRAPINHLETLENHLKSKELDLLYLEERRLQRVEYLKERRAFIDDPANRHYYAIPAHFHYMEQYEKLNQKLRAEDCAMASEQKKLSIFAKRWAAVTNIVDDEDFDPYEDGTATKAREPEELEEVLHEKGDNKNNKMDQESLHLSGLIF